MQPKKDPAAVRVGILGAGGIAAEHARSLSEIPSARLVRVGALEAVPAMPDLVAAQGAELCSPDELFDRGGLDVVIVATPTDTHAEWVVRAAEAGLSVFCEKPLTRDAAQAEEVAAAVDASGTKLAVGHVVRYMPAYAGIRQAVRDGEIGTPGVARLRRVSAGAGTRSWYANPTRSGGSLLDLGIHDLDWALWTFGPVARVSATIRGGPGHDVAMVTLNHRAGPLSSIEVSWCHPKFATSIEVSGSEGLLRADSNSSTSFLLEPRKQAEGMERPAVSIPPDRSGPNPYRQELEEALRWFAGGDPPRAVAEDGIAAVRVAELAMESAERGEPVSPDDARSELVELS